MNFLRSQLIFERFNPPWYAHWIIFDCNEEFEVEFYCAFSPKKIPSGGEMDKLFNFQI